MHISEGVLSGPALVSGMILAGAGTAIGLKRLDYDRIAHAGILSASFFVASLIHLPIGPSSVHLILNGIVGLLLGWAAFPAILTALLLQAMLFQFGGITTLGVNTVIMALPAVIAHYLFSPLIWKSHGASLTAAFGCGAVSVLLSALLMSIALIATQESFVEIAYAVIGFNIPVMIIEGVVTAFCVSFIKRVQPSLLSGMGEGR